MANSSLFFPISIDLFVTSSDLFLMNNSNSFFLFNFSSNNFEVDSNSSYSNFFCSIGLKFSFSLSLMSLSIASKMV